MLVESQGGSRPLGILLNLNLVKIVNTSHKGVHL